MKNIILCFKYVLMSISAIIMLGCLAFALLFGIASISAINQTCIDQLIVLCSFCYLFSLAGSWFLTITNQLYESTRR
jgi:hypothetical protein